MKSLTKYQNGIRSLTTAWPVNLNNICHDLQLDACVLKRNGVESGAVKHLFSYTSPLSLETQFRITVFYRGVKVSEQLVENEAGIRLVYR